jgi:hypothetical protein
MEKNQTQKGLLTSVVFVNCRSSDVLDSIPTRLPAVVFVVVVVVVVVVINVGYWPLAYSMVRVTLH